MWNMCPGRRRNMDKEIAAQITKDILIAALNKGDINGDIPTIIKAYVDIFTTVNGCCKNESGTES